MNIVKREAVENGRRRRRLVVSAVLLALLPATQAARGQSLPDSLASLAGAVLPAVVIVTASGELAPRSRTKAVPPAP